MTAYASLKDRLDDGRVVVLDGAVGTDLQRRGAPMSNTAWAATALQTHPFTVRRMHEDYLRAGVDVITTNTYSAARHNLEPLGLGDLTGELNLRAVMLAEEARERAAAGRETWIAGWVSNFGIITGGEGARALHRHALPRSEITERQARLYLHEQARMLAEAGCDLLLAECTSNHEQRRWVVEACVATGLPVWVGFKGHLDPGEPTVKVGYTSDAALMDGFDEVMALGGDAVCVFHTPVDATGVALAAIRERWPGPLGAYPEAERADYTKAWRDEGVPTRLTPEEFVARARAWVDQGVQIIGGCCGIELEHIRPLRAALPERVPGR